MKYIIESTCIYNNKKYYLYNKTEILFSGNKNIAVKLSLKEARKCILFLKEENDEYYIRYLVEIKIYS